MLKSLQIMSHKLWAWKLRPLAKIIKIFLRIIFSTYMPPQLKLPRSTQLGHSAMGVILNEDSVLGENCFIGSYVILGGQPQEDGAPTLEDDVVVHTGARIFGPITVGRGSVIAAGAILTRSVPPQSLVVGIPGKVIRSGIDHRQFRPGAWKDTPAAVTAAGK